MTNKDYPLVEGEYEVFSVRRKTEWFMLIMCLIAAPILALMAWGNTIPVWIIGSVAALLLCYYGIRLIVCGFHDWAAVTNQRVIVCTYDLLFREKLRDCPVHELDNMRVYQSMRASRKDLVAGEIELRLTNGKKFSVPLLEDGKGFLETIRRCIHANHDEQDE